MFGRLKNFRRLRKLGRRDAALAQQAYRGIGRRERRVGRWHLQPQHSTSERAVYKDPVTNDVKVAIRGTHNLADVGTDALLAVGQLKRGTRYKRELAALNKIRSENQGSKVSLTGHSLGGSLVDELSRKTGLKGTAYNAGFGINTLFRKSNKNVQHIRTRYDPVSGIGKLFGQKFEGETSSGGHGIANFVK